MNSSSSNGASGTVSVPTHGVYRPPVFKRTEERMAARAEAVEAALHGQMTGIRFDNPNRRDVRRAGPTFR